MTGDDNPVARSNVIPHLHKSVEPGFHAFCFARPATGASGSFVIAGSGKAGDGPAQVYTVYDLYPFLADEIVRRGAAQHGLTWHFARLPVVDLEYEMDCRSVPVEHHGVGFR